MKKLQYICLGFIAIVCMVVASCVREVDSESTVAEDGAQILSVSEAKRFFESEISRRSSRSEQENNRKILDPGDFTPLWSRAWSVSADSLGNVDLPIEGAYVYTAIRASYSGGRSHISEIPVYQKLTVVKNENTGQMSCYILNIIPTEKYAQQHTRDYLLNNFHNSGTQSGFSGITAHYTLDGLLIRVDEYRNGERTRGVMIPKAIRKNEKGAKAKVRSIIGGIKLYAYQATQSRSDEYGGDDGFWDDFWDWYDDWNDDPESHPGYSWEDDGSGGDPIMGHIDNDSDDNDDGGFWNDWTGCDNCMGVYCYCGEGDDWHDGDNGGEGGEGNSDDDPFPVEITQYYIICTGCHTKIYFSPNSASVRCGRCGKVFIRQ